MITYGFLPDRSLTILSSRRCVASGGGMPLFATSRNIFHSRGFEIRENVSCPLSSGLFLAPCTRLPQWRDPETGSFASHHVTTCKRYVISSHLLLSDPASRTASSALPECGLREAPRGIHLAVSVHSEECTGNSLTAYWGYKRYGDREVSAGTETFFSMVDLDGSSPPGAASTPFSPCRPHGTYDHPNIH